jgi:hypothetical protein
LMHPLPWRLLAEFLGTACLASVVKTGPPAPYRTLNNALPLFRHRPGDA